MSARLASRAQARAAAAPEAPLPTLVAVETNPPPTSIDALLEAIYQSALKPGQYARLHGHLIAHFREDRARDDTPLTRAIIGHIQRALRLGAAHSAMQRERERLMAVVEAAVPPIIVMDGRWRILGMNRVAQQLVQQHAELSVEGEQLQCRNPGWLQALLAQVDEHGYASTRSPEETLIYAFKSQPEQATYSLLFIDARRSIRQSITYLAQRSGLTPREIEIVDLSMRGLDLDTLSAHLGVSLHTLRQHIKNIYAKTGVHNQNGLVVLVLQNVVLEHAGRSHDDKLLPHIVGLSHSRILRLGHGRQLSFAEFGAPNGVPVLYFHSVNNSRLELLMHTDRLREMGVRLISMDRPGVGYTSAAEHSDYRGYVADVVALLDHLHVGRVHLLSASAGCAHAITCAHELPERVLSVHCAAAVPPINFILASKSKVMMNRASNQLFRLVPSLLRPMIELALFGQTVESMLSMLAANRHNNPFSFTSDDIDYINEPQRLPYFVASMMESLRQGASAWVSEAALVNRPWPIELSQVKQPVHLWHGNADVLVPRDAMQAFAQALPNGHLHVLQDTHLLLLRKIERVVALIQ